MTLGKIRTLALQGSMSHGMYARENCQKIYQGLEEIEEALNAMIECTGGSKHWNGETNTALKKIEKVLGNGA